MKVYQYKQFSRFARAERITGKRLIEAVERAERGLIDADLGGGLIKQRVAREGQGRSGGYRVMIVFRSGDLSICLFGFAKNDESNIGDRQLTVLRRLASTWLSAAPAEIAEAVKQGTLIEVKP